MFSILVFLGVQKRRKKKQTYNTEYLRKRNPCNLDNLHILSDPVHQHSSLGTFICCPLSLLSPLASFAMQCVASSGGYIAFYTTLVSHPHEFHLLICQHSWSQIFCNPPFVPQLKKDGCFYENLTQKKMGFHQRGKKKSSCHDWKVGLLKGQYVEHLKPHSRHVIPFAYLFIYSLSLLKTECKKKQNKKKQRKTH